MVGRTTNRLPCYQLPTIDNACRNHSTYLQEKAIQNVDAKQLAATVAYEVLNLYHAVPLTTIRIDKATEKNSRMRQKWRNIEKSRKRDSATEEKRDSDLKKELYALCDMSKEYTEREALE